MTKQKDVTINLNKATRKYFYPDIFTGDLLELKIPTVDELVDLGKENVLSLKKDYRCEERKLRKLIAQTEHTIKTLPQQLAETKAQKCDWYGYGIAINPASVKSRNLSQAEQAKQLEENIKRVHTCRFGSHVASWCKQNPHPCTATTRTCMLRTSKVVVEEVGKWQRVVESGNPDPEAICPHYNACYGVQPLKELDCVFMHGGKELEDDCLQFLRTSIEDYRARIKFIKKYTSNIRAALHSPRCVHKPVFSYDAGVLLALATNGTRVVLLSDAFFDYHLMAEVNFCMGTYLSKCFTDGTTENYTFDVIMDDGTHIQIPRYHFSHRGVPLCMTKDDFDFLATHDDFRRIWLKMTCGTNTEPTNDLWLSYLKMCSERTN